MCACMGGACFESLVGEVPAQRTGTKWRAELVMTARILYMPALTGLKWHSGRARMVEFRYDKTEAGGLCKMLEMKHLPRDDVPS